MYQAMNTLILFILLLGLRKVTPAPAPASSPTATSFNLKKYRKVKFYQSTVVIYYLF